MMQVLREIPFFDWDEGETASCEKINFEPGLPISSYGRNIKYRLVYRYNLCKEFWISANKQRTCQRQ